MKLIGAIILSFLLLTQTFSKWMVLLDYQVNKEYISQNLCENKSRPMLHCNGKCQLSKKLAAENEQNNNPTSNHTVKTGLSEILFIQPLPVFSLSENVSMRKNLYPAYVMVAYSAPLSSIFHPPSA